MRRFTLSQLLMGTALVAIVLAFSQTGGCGGRYAMIESLRFSSDDSRIAVTKLNARVPRTWLKRNMADISRTISWLDVSTGNSRGVIHEDFMPGNLGPAVGYWCLCRTSALCDPSNNHIAMCAFGGGDVTLNVDTTNPTVVSLQHPAYNLAYSKSGRFLAASGLGELSVLDTKSATVVMRAEANDLPLLGASLMSFANDDTCIILGVDSGVHVWDIATATQRSTVIQGSEPWIKSIAVARNDSVVVCSYDWVRRYDLDGNIIATLAEKGAYLCAIASDGNRLVISGDSKLTIYDLNTNNMLRSLSFEDVTALTLSSGGEELAVGDYKGRVTLIDTSSGARRWISNPPGRYRWPGALPWTFLIVWICIAWRLSRRHKIVDARNLIP